FFHFPLLRKIWLAMNISATEMAHYHYPASYIYIMAAHLFAFISLFSFFSHTINDAMLNLIIDQNSNLNWSGQIIPQQSLADRRRIYMLMYCDRSYSKGGKLLWLKFTILLLAM
ncbi:hypothetical protein ACJX0J_018119, partial [Zea mays]